MQALDDSRVCLNPLADERLDMTLHPSAFVDAFECILGGAFVLGADPCSLFAFPHVVMDVVDVLR